MEEAKKLVKDNGGNIHVRQVSSMPRTLEVMPRMKKRYSFRKDYPSEFKYRCKCLILFQNLDGVDVILFGLYVYEHDETNAPPNQRAVYVSYLDSIYYMRPRNMRTFVYHELLTSYLDYVRCKGYSTAHIWACPPLKGDDYILFAKPEDQKTPKDDRLRQWYIDMLQECQRRGIVGKMTNAHELYFSNDKNDATVLPYMEGDYFPGELENIIKDIDEGKNLSKKPDKSSKSKGKKDGSKKKKAKKGNREGTRSGGLDQDLLAASGIQPEGVDVKSIQEGGKDYVMSRLGETIYRMKDNFIVAYLNWEGQSPENMVVPKDIMEYREKHGIKAIKPCSESDESKVEAKNEDEKKADDSTDVPDKVESVDAAKEDVTVKTEPDGEEKKNDSSDVANGEVKVKAEPDETQSKSESSGADAEKNVEGNGAEDAKPEEATKDDKADGDGAEKVEDAGATSEKEKDDKPSSNPEEEAKSEDEKTKAEAADEKPDAVMADAEGEKDNDEEEKSGAGESKEETKPEVEEKEEEKKGEEEDGEEEQKKPEEENEVKAKDGEENEKEEEKKPDEDEKMPDGEDKEEEDKPDGEDKEEEKKADGDDQKEEKKAEEASEEKKSTVEEEKDSKPKPDGDVTKPDGESEKESKSEGDAVKTEDASAEKTDDKEKGETKDVEMKDAQPEGAKSPAREGKFAAMEKRKKDLEGDEEAPKPEEAKSKPEETPSKSMTRDSKGRLVKIIDDDEEEMDCEFLNNRQLFLNLCQGNHYQFDSLRRAKHTSMMVLWHLHNRDAPKFVQQCALCSREILQGKRYHCPTCADFDQCYECLRNPNIPRHPHPLQAIPVGNAQSNLTPEQRKERQRSIQLHMTLLLHASTCRSTSCASANCAKMKGLLKHGTQCKVKATGGCNVCKRIWALLQIHAKQCKQDNCPVPNCMAIRERYRQLQLQQQAMDDRRRQMMNQTYHQQAR
jgi:hypothetical protein